uniref:5'-deoxynucleotidase HDDC2 isoform X2 n=1 Tax=Myxine glutinosa TaxID=7769 RepID=UPI00358F48C2
MANDPLQFLQVLGKLKRTERAGWVRRGIRSPESVSDHMYRMAIMAFLPQDPVLCKERCMKLALVHDMAEALVGDITPADNIPAHEKHRREEEAMKSITSLVDESVGKEILSLWEEYEDQTSSEAKFVKDLDKFEMVLQAFEYEQEERRPGHLQEFFDSTVGKFHHPQVQAWVSSLSLLRSSGLHVPASVEDDRVDNEPHVEKGLSSP